MLEFIKQHETPHERSEGGTFLKRPSMQAKVMAYEISQMAPHPTYWNPGPGSHVPSRPHI